jgi:hypothetical protein
LCSFDEPQFNVSTRDQVYFFPANGINHSQAHSDVC